jgi:hypothetical protein
MKTISSPSGENEGESFTEWLNWYAMPIGPFGVWADAHTLQNRTADTLATTERAKNLVIILFDVWKEPL